MAGCELEQMMLMLCPRFPLQYDRYLFASVWHATFRFLHLNYPPSCCVTGLNMLLSGRGCSFPLSGPLTALPACALYSHHPHSPGLATRLPRGYSLVYTSRQLGRMDRLGLDYPCDNSKSGHLRYAKDFGQPESEEKEDSRECGNEWRELLQQARG